MDLTHFLTHAGMNGAPGFYHGAVAFLLAFLLGHAAALAYMLTHTGMSYSRSFVQSLVLITIVVTVSMMVMGSNIVVAFGLIGALAVIRFRNILKDTRDTVFLFFALVAGMALGAGLYALAIGATAFFVATVFYLYWAGLGSRQISDVFLRFHLDPAATSQEEVERVLRRFCSARELIAMRLQDTGPGEVSYRLVTRDPTRSQELMDQLRAFEGVSGVYYVMQEEQEEV